MNRCTPLFIILILFMACSESEVISESGDRIDFNSSVENHTRAVSTFGPITLSTLRGSADGFAVSTSGLPLTQMNNVIVKYSGGKWNYAGDYYWPSNANQNVSFTAYAPAGTPGVTMTSSGITVSTFTPSTSLSNQIDLLYASPANFNRAGSGTNGVPLTFKHLLTQIVFSFNSIRMAGITSVNSVELTVPNPTGIYNGTTWSNSGNTITYTIPVNGSISSLPMQTTPVLMVPKTSIPLGTRVKINYTVAFVVNVSQTRNLNTLTNVTSWRSGYRIVYNIDMTGGVSSSLDNGQSDIIAEEYSFE